MADQVILAVGDMCGPARKNPGAAACFEYFGESRAGTPARSYYSLPLPDAGWHLVSLDSEVERGYAATLDEIAGSGECCPVSAEGKVDVKNASFILEGIRDVLDNADLNEGAAFVQRDIERLNDLVFRYNSAAGQAAR